MVHIFISYSKKDIDLARFIRVSIENEGIPIWMDENSISAGDKWIKAIESAINNSTAIVVLMSNNSKDSDWVNREIQYAEDLGIPIYPILINGQPFFRLRDRQYEDMTLGLSKPLSGRFLRQLYNTLPGTQQHVNFSIQCGDVLEADADVLVLKYAQSFYGVDLVVMERLGTRNIKLDMISLEHNGYATVETQGTIKAKRVLFVATSSLSTLDYSGVRAFAKQSFQLLQKEFPETSSVVLTIHGVGIGLDEGETLRAQLGGIFDSLAKIQFDQLTSITILEIYQQRCEYLQELASTYLSNVELAQPIIDKDPWTYALAPQIPEQISQSQSASEQLAITVFFPNDGTLDDIYYYGILRPAGMQGFLCENVGTDAEVNQLAELTKLERFIERAKLVLVYLDNKDITIEFAFQLGIVYGKGKRIVFISSDGTNSRADSLFSDCTHLKYSKITELESAILQLLRDLD